MSHHHPPSLLAVLPTALWPVSVNSVAISWTHGGQLPVDPPVCHQHTLPSAGSHTLSVPTLIRLGIHSRSLHIPWGLLVPFDSLAIPSHSAAVHCGPGVSPILNVLFLKRALLSFHGSEGQQGQDLMCTAWGGLFSASQVTPCCCILHSGRWRGNNHDTG